MQSIRFLIFILIFSVTAKIWAQKLPVLDPPVEAVTIYTDYPSETQITQIQVPDDPDRLRWLLAWLQSNIAVARSEHPSMVAEGALIQSDVDPQASEISKLYQDFSRQAQVPVERSVFPARTFTNFEDWKNKSLDAFAPYSRNVITILRTVTVGGVFYYGLIQTPNTDVAAAAIVGTVVGVMSGSINYFMKGFGILLSKHIGGVAKVSQTSLIRTLILATNKWMKTKFSAARFPKSSFEDLPESSKGATLIKWGLVEVLFMEIIKPALAWQGFAIEPNFLALQWNILWNSAFTVASQGTWDSYVIRQTRHRLAEHPEFQPRYDTSNLIRSWVISTVWSGILVSGQGAADSLGIDRWVLPTLGHAIFGAMGLWRYVSYMNRYNKTHPNGLPVREDSPSQVACANVLRAAVSK